MNAQDIQRGFNSGYSLRTNAPKLADKYAKILQGREDGYAIGFLAGIKEKDKEKFKGRTKNYAFKNTPTKYDKDRFKDKDKGDRDR